MEALEYKSESDKDNQSPRKNGFSGAVERNAVVQAREHREKTTIVGCIKGSCNYFESISQ